MWRELACGAAGMALGAGAVAAAWKSAGAEAEANAAGRASPVVAVRAAASEDPGHARLPADNDEVQEDLPSPSSMVSSAEDARADCDEACLAGLTEAVLSGRIDALDDAFWPEIGALAERIESDPRLTARFAEAWRRIELPDGPDVEPGPAVMALYFLGNRLPADRQRALARSGLESGDVDRQVMALALLGAGDELRDDARLAAESLLARSSHRLALRAALDTMTYGDGTLPPRVLGTASRLASDHEDAEVRAAAYQVIANRGGLDEQTVRTLRRGLEDASSAVRVTALESLLYHSVSGPASPHQARRELARYRSVAEAIANDPSEPANVRMRALELMVAAPEG